MTKRRRTIYMGVMIVGGLALAVDRCVLSDGAITPAQAIAIETVPVSARPSAPITPPASSTVPVVPFPSEIAAFDPEIPLRDLFSPPAWVRDASATHTASDKRSANVSGPVTNERFTSTHRLIGVLLYDGLEIAIVDGLWLHIGEHVDGCTLQCVEGNQARFRCGEEEEAVLRVTDNTTLTTD